MEEKTKGRINKKNIKRVFLVILLLAIFIGAAVGAQYFRVREFKGYEKETATELAAQLSGYTFGEEKLFLYSNDGARAIGADGAAVWEASYQLDNPELVFCKDVAAIADIGGNMVYVVAENGIPYNYQVIYPIVRHEVAKQGVTAVLLDNGTEDFIQMYDIHGNLRVDINTKTKVDGIPIDIALSEDGKKLVTLYVTFQGDSMMCKVTFYNADEVGKNYINNIVGQKTFGENVLVYDVQFLNEDTLCVLLEHGFALYRMTETPELICENKTEQTIIEIVCVENGLYVVTETETKQRTMSFYNTKGEEKQVWKKIPEYEAIAATSEEVVFFSPQGVEIYRTNGSLKFSTAFEQSLEAVFPAGDNRYFLVDTAVVETIKLINKTKREEQTEE